MYSYVRAIARLSQDNAHWEDTDLQSMTTYDIATKYNGAYVVLNHPLIVGDVTWNLKDSQQELVMYAGTLSQFLVDLEDTTLPVTAGVPKIDRKHAIFGDAVEAGFIPQCSDFFLGNNGVGLPPDSLDHATLTHEDSPDYVGMRETMLANVNGFYHFTDANSSGFHIVDANKTRMKSNRNYIGLYSFGAIGKMSFERITEDMLVFDKDPEDKIREIHVKCSQVQCGKKAFLVLGGYLLVPDQETLAVTSPGVLSLRAKRYPFAERYHESFETIEMPGISFPNIPDNPGFVVRDRFLEEEFLKAYFTLSQSFVVFLDVEDLIYERDYLERDVAPHTYLQYQNRPRYPLVVGMGRHDVYWQQHEARVWVLRGDRCIRENRMSATLPSEDRPCFDDALVSGHPEEYSSAFFLKMSRETVEIKVE